MADKMTTQKTTFENKPYSALFFNGPYESRNVGIKLYFRYQLFFCLYHMKIAEFKATSNRDPSLVFWMSYLDMVSTLLMFTHAERDGIWDLYLYAFRCMLPWFFRYDHTNYARWGAVYIADTTQLPAEILQEFRAGNFVVKQSNAKYNYVDPDQSQEWLNATGKKGGGIVGITRTATELSRWSLSYNLRFHISYNPLCFM
jgi:hypothetical protein